MTDKKPPHPSSGSKLQDRASDDLAALVPIITPRIQIAASAWPGSHRTLVHPALALTCAGLHADGELSFMTREAAALLVNEGLDYWDRALRNLHQLADARLWTHEKRDDSGALLFVAMMHADGLGSSRLLRSEELQNAIGEEFVVAIPDRSCGLAFPVARLSASGAAEVVRKMHGGATTPILPELMTLQELAFA